MVQYCIIMSSAEAIDRPRPIEIIQKFREDPSGETVSFMVDRLNEALYHVPVEIDEAVEERYLQLRESEHKKCVPIIVSSHSIHADALALAHINNELLRLEDIALNSPLDGFVLPIATSVGSGHQGKLLQKGLPTLMDRCRELGTNITETTRQADQDRYGLRRNGHKVVRELMRAADNNQGIAMFPEASVQSGRLLPVKTTGDLLPDAIELAKYKLGEIGFIDAPVYGMQKFDAETVTKSVDVTSRNGRKAFIVPVAINGINRLVRPTDDRKNAPTVKGIIGTVVFGRDMFAVNMRIGMPMTIDEIHKDMEKTGITYSDQAFADYIGAHVAALLPKDKRGYYSAHLAA